MSTEKTEMERMLEGRQAVEHGDVMEGDLLVLHDKSITPATEFDIGSNVGEYLDEGYRVYRRIPVAKQGGDEQWRFVAGGTPANISLQPEQPRARTDDAAKPPLAWLPWGGLEEVAMVQKFGADKYGSWDNYKKGMEVSRNISCAIRHLSAYMQGQRIDSESGRSHLAHAACRLLFALQNQHDKVAIEDAPERPS